MPTQNKKVRQLAGAARRQKTLCIFFCNFPRRDFLDLVKGVSGEVA